MDINIVRPKALARLKGFGKRTVQKIVDKRGEGEPITLEWAMQNLPSTKLSAEDVLWSFEWPEEEIAAYDRTRRPQELPSSESAPEKEESVEEAAGAQARDETDEGDYLVTEEEGRPEVGRQSLQLQPHTATARQGAGRLPVPGMGLGPVEPSRMTGSQVRSMNEARGMEGGGFGIKDAEVQQGRGNRGEEMGKGEMTQEEFRRLAGVLGYGLHDIADLKIMLTRCIPQSRCAGAAEKFAHSHAPFVPQQDRGAPDASRARASHAGQDPTNDAIPKILDPQGPGRRSASQTPHLPRSQPSRDVGRWDDLRGPYWERKFAWTPIPEDLVTRYPHDLGEGDCFDDHYYPRSYRPGPGRLVDDLGQALGQGPKNQPYCQEGYDKGQRPWEHDLSYYPDTPSPMSNRDRRPWDGRPRYFGVQYERGGDYRGQERGWQSPGGFQALPGWDPRPRDHWEPEMGWQSPGRFLAHPGPDPRHGENLDQEMVGQSPGGFQALPGGTPRPQAKPEKVGSRTPESEKQPQRPQAKPEKVGSRTPKSEKQNKSEEQRTRGHHAEQEDHRYQHPGDSYQPDPRQPAIAIAPRNRAPPGTQEDHKQVHATIGKEEKDPKAKRQH